MMLDKKLVDWMGGQLDWMSQFSSKSAVLFQSTSRELDCQIYGVVDSASVKIGVLFHSL